MMGRKEILDKLKVTEDDLHKKIEHAQKRKNEIIESAQRQARKLENEVEVKIKKYLDDMLDSAKKELEKERKTVLDQANEQAEMLKQKAQIDKAIEFYINKFKEQLNV